MRGFVIQRFLRDTDWPVARSETTICNKTSIVDLIQLIMLFNFSALFSMIEPERLPK